MSFEEIKEYKLNDSLLIRKVGEIAMVYNKENGDMYEFNDVGADILALLVITLTTPLNSSSDPIGY